MTAFEILSAILLVAMLVVCVGTVMQVRAIVREVRGEARETRSHLSGGVERVDALEHALLRAFRESIEGRPAAAVATIAVAEAASKPHRHIWRFGSEEKTNGEIVRFYVCSVPGCKEILRHVAGEPDPVEGSD